jgi:LysM repeat protein
MTSNAKVGLLMGLLVIFVFAFIVNGMSGFRRTKNDNYIIPLVDVSPRGIKPDIRPENFPPQPIPDQPPEETPPPKKKEQFQVQSPKTAPPVKADNYTKPAKQTWPKVHIVRQGENLADIAKEYYGTKEGNRRVNIKRIFEANRKLLDSPDMIYPGQKLIIPPLWASASDKNGIDGIFPDSMFEKVESIGRRHL